MFKCPGAANLRTPTITIKKCPDCGSDVELFSIDMKMDCPGCGRPVFNNIGSCIEYCKYAEQCLGPELYSKFKKRGKSEKEVSN